MFFTLVMVTIVGKKSVYQSLLVRLNGFIIIEATSGLGYGGQCVETICSFKASLALK